MGTGWRRAFCTTIPRDTEKLQQEQEKSTFGGDQIPSPSPSPRSCARFGFLYSGSNPSTPRLQSQSPRLSCKTNASAASNNETDTPLISPKLLHCKTTSNTPKSSTTKSPKPRFGSNPSSPRSPFSILKNSLRLTTRNSCGVCMQSVKTGQGMAIYTAECSHTFHYPCIAAHVRKQSTLICPVCNSSWKDVPLLAIHKLQQENHQKDIMVDAVTTTSAKNCPEMKSNQYHQPHKNFLPHLTTMQRLDSRAYNDDEPLVSPKFVSIPEANEGDELEVEEFQGFFVNPVSSDDALGSYPNRDYRNVEVSLLPEAAVVAVTRTHETLAFVLKVKAPPPPPLAHNSNSVHFKDPARRAPIDLVTVLDVSGSMSGAKLQMLKRAMRLVISSLSSADRLSIVAFSATPKRLVPLRRMDPHGQRSARRIIDRLACSQGTCVGDALKKATKILDDRRERNPVASIMLLSDGQDENVQTNGDNQGRRSTHESSTRFAHIEIPVHSSGFGKKAGYTKETAEDAFSRCVGGLLSVVVQDLRIQHGFASGSDPAEITAVYSCNGRPTALGSDCIRLGDLYAEEEKELLVEMRVPASSLGSHVLSVSCFHKDPATQEVVYGREQALVVPRPQAVRSSLPRIERLRNLFITTRAIAESRRLIEYNELTRAMQLLSSARGLLLQSRCQSADEYVRGLEAELAEVQWRRQYEQQLMEKQGQIIQRRKVNEKEVGLFLDENGEPLTPTSAWREAEKLAKVAMMKKSVNRVSDLHGFENARF